MVRHTQHLRVTEQVMADWAEGTLGEWLPGWTDYDDVLGGQYRIRQVEDNTYQVETSDGWVAGRFRLRVAVVELP